MTPTAEEDQAGAAGLVELLADPHRYFTAYQRLLSLGAGAARAARDGLSHDSPRVRMHCCKVLDHVMDSADVPWLVAVLDDPAPAVRIEALHALACDRCKSNACRPGADVLARAAQLLAADPDPHVRAMAAELVGAWVHTHADAASALESATASDPSPSVRKKAAWYAPGGAIYRRTKPAQS